MAVVNNGFVVWSVPPLVCPNGCFDDEVTHDVDNEPEARHTVTRAKARSGGLAEQQTDLVQPTTKDSPRGIHFIHGSEGADVGASQGDTKMRIVRG
ncbi:hypothetical protein O1611_g3822 [Lasiodiplodia mahajangana]|uniref:Uncharacterized protein n=1 Tax=Lasiodiplodia mahajangana TaxID=1108764 RepID=A0ACC2JQS9_9PEZI|nr:hypothetical protein O1611_g3822 [Lasiodiplodia mahajangana]